MSSVLDLVRDRLPTLFRSNSNLRRSIRRSQVQRTAGQMRVRLHVPTVNELRLRELRQACHLLTDGFENLQSLLATYVDEIQSETYSSGEEEVENFLQWMATQEGVSEEQRDLIICQRAKLSVEYVVLARKLAHARFQALLIRNRSSNAAAALTGNSRLHLNPVRVLATLETHALVDQEEMLPATVLFFPVGDEIRSLVIDGDVVQVMEALSAGPLKLRHMAQLIDFPQDELENLMQELLAAGVVAVGSK